MSKASFFFVPSFSTIFMALSMTPEMTSAISKGLEIIIAAFFVGIVNMIMAKRAIAPVEKKVDAMIPVLAKVDTHVNSEKTKDQGEIATKNIEIDLLREVIEELKRSASLLAQAKAVNETNALIRDAAVAGALTPASIVAPAQTRQVEVDIAATAKNTEETSRNTARTEHTIDAMKKQL